MQYYAGIGSRRRTPKSIHNLMTSIAVKLEDQNYILRSGHALGADQAFEAGVSNPLNKQIFTAKDATPEAIRIASEFHPFWDNCDDYAKKLHGRNVFIILGKDLKSPVKFVICFTPDGKAIGGTGLGMRIADFYQIPIFNLYFPSVIERFNKFTNKHDFNPELL